jgi:hypothetical protein
VSAETAKVCKYVKGASGGFCPKLPVSPQRFWFSPKFSKKGILFGSIFERVQIVRILTIIGKTKKICPQKIRRIRQHNTKIQPMIP